MRLRSNLVKDLISTSGFHMQIYKHTWMLTPTGAGTTTHPPQTHIQNSYLYNSLFHIYTYM